MNFERLKTFLQYLIPQHGLSQTLGWLADKPLGSITTTLINKFIKRYGVDMSEAVEEKTENYPTFNQFFTRAIKLEYRPVAPNTPLVSPVDGMVSQLGHINQGRLIQAKGHDFSCLDLLGGDKNLSALFGNGQFATIYLSPKDYHRVHMPLAGRLTEMHHIPGKLFSVNPLTARNIPNLFARNERVVCIFQTELGKVAQILVGATIVGSIETVWHGTVTPPSLSTVSRCYYSESDDITFKQADEMGRFKLGSTVILLFEPNKIVFNNQLSPNSPIKMGEHLANLYESSLPPKN